METKSVPYYATFPCNFQHPNNSPDKHNLLTAILCEPQKTMLYIFILLRFCLWFNNNIVRIREVTAAFILCMSGMCPARCEILQPVQVIPNLEIRVSNGANSKPDQSNQKSVFLTTVHNTFLYVENPIPSNKTQSFLELSYPLSDEAFLSFHIFPILTPQPLGPTAHKALYSYNLALIT